MGHVEIRSSNLPMYVYTQVSVWKAVELLFIAKMGDGTVGSLFEKVLASTSSTSRIPKDNHLFKWWLRVNDRVMQGWGWHASGSESFGHSVLAQLGCHPGRLGQSRLG